jgi:hypothetical protein
MPLPDFEAKGNPSQVRTVFINGVRLSDEAVQQITARMGCAHSRRIVLVRCGVRSLGH